MGEDGQVQGACFPTLDATAAQISGRVEPGREPQRVEWVEAACGEVPGTAEERRRERGGRLRRLTPLQGGLIKRHGGSRFAAKGGSEECWIHSQR
jgi:hypothetical protein